MNFDIKTKTFNEYFLPSLMDDFDLKSTKRIFSPFYLIDKILYYFISNISNKT